MVTTRPAPAAPRRGLARPVTFGLGGGMMPRPGVAMFLPGGTA